jgi:5-methyltetrahydrofolate--homocysteine methyltransferase
MTLSDGYAVMPEQSTVAIVAHHPQAVYFGMKSGFIPERKAPDELIAGTKRGGELPPEEEPPEGSVEEEGEMRAGEVATA